MRALARDVAGAALFILMLAIATPFLMAWNAWARRAMRRADRRLCAACRAAGEEPPAAFRDDLPLPPRQLGSRSRAEVRRG